MSALPDPSKPLDAGAARDAFAAILDGAADDEAIGRFLLTLAGRGETPAEIAAAAGVLRERMRAIGAPEDAIDVCGTGGDGSHSLNVSTAVAFVVAASGVPVAKHGNRGASSKCGTADVLEALGWRGDLPLERVEACLAEVGITFLFAQAHHPAMARVAPIRRRLGTRTIFNLLGPLANPAAVRRQMIGVFAEPWLEPMAEAALALGGEAVLAVHGGGLDEIAVDTPSRLVRGGGGGVTRETFDPATHGLGPYPRAAIAGGEPAENAGALTDLFRGRGRPAYRAIVIANAGAALTLAGRSLEAGLAEAAQALDSGAAADRLARFIAFR
ncbi:MAG: anthranilate phosphoribosyltransferase [Sphingomonadaceae bacterium]